MSNLWQKIRCRILVAHQWEAKRIDGEQAFVCRARHKRHFGPKPPEGDLGVFSGGGG